MCKKGDSNYWDEWSWRIMGCSRGVRGGGGGEVGGWGGGGGHRFWGRGQAGGGVSQWVMLVFGG